VNDPSVFILFIVVDTRRAGHVGAVGLLGSSDIHRKRRGQWVWHDLHAELLTTVCQFDEFHNRFARVKIDRVARLEKNAQHPRQLVQPEFGFPM